MNKFSGSWMRQFVERRGPTLTIIVCLAMASIIGLQHYRSVAAESAKAEGVSLGLSVDELAAVRRLIGLRPENTGAKGTQLSTRQVRGLEERLERLEQAVPLNDSLSAAANNDLRLLQRDIHDVKEQEVFQGQMIKDQRAELRDDMKAWVEIMVTLDLAILAFFWKIVPYLKDKAADSLLIESGRK